ncbi:SAG family member, partial [Eimeria necatrix]
MFRVHLATFLSVSLLWLSEKSSQAAAVTTVKYTAKLGSSVECLDEVNNAREAAGLANFIKATDPGDQISDPGSEELTNGDWKDLCEYLVPTQPEAYNSQAAAQPFKDGTYAFKALTAAQPNCTETVDYWKAAYKSFTGLPPSKTEAGK